MLKFSIVCGLVVALVGAHVAGEYLTNIADAYKAAIERAAN